jgi:2-keto-4-pentenoate hydratase/2-oxohepta-3-ene-1,7-dioic acid hydratase in catechol pathway
LLFAKLNTSVIGDGDMITWSESITTQVDWEGELGVVIGRTARNVREADAYNHIYGYTVGNDVSARDLQSNDGQWIRAKGLDTFGPLGPCLVTRDEIADPHQLTIMTSVNGEQLQYASTGLMLYKIPQLIAYCSRAFTLQPGDVILKGTPAGVGKGMKPPRFLKDGDEVSVTIDGIGTITNRCQII